jgi:hypothetical protein
MSNEITINITASGEDALKVLKALSTLSGVEVTTSTNTSPLALPVKVKKNLGGRPGKTGVFKSKADLHTFFYNHCAAGKMAFYTTNEVARNAEVSWSVADYWAKRTKNFFRKINGPRRDLYSSNFKA